MSQIKATKTRKSSKRKENAPKKSAKGKSRQINAEDSRASAGQVTTYEPPTEERMIAAFSKMRKDSISGTYNSKPIKINQSSDTWVRAVAQAGASRSTLLNCAYVQRNNLAKFLEYPAKYLTLHDLCFIYAITGITVPRQIELLWYGVESVMIKRTGTKYTPDAPNPSDLSRLVSDE